MTATLRYSIIALGLLATASPAAAQWTRVLDVPASNVFSVWANGDTIAAGTDTSVYISTNAGASFRSSRRPVAGVTSIQAVRIRNGRLYAGTFGQGVFVSDDLGATWQGFNEGLVGGVLNSQLKLSDFEIRGDSLYAATSGAGVYVRSLVAAGTWSHFGEEFEPNQASNLNSIALGGTRLLATGGANGTVFFRDPGAADWTVSSLANAGLLPGTQPQSVLWTGSGWAVSSSRGMFRSVLGQEPWAFTNLHIGSLLWSTLALQKQRLFGAFDITNAVVIEISDDDGATWQELELQPNVFVFRLAVSGAELYAGRADGLWVRSTATASVAGGGEGARLRFALDGPQPVRDQIRFRFELPGPGTASIEVFDVAGRREADRIQQSLSAGAHEVSWDAHRLRPGVYEARLTAEGRQEVIRLVRVR